jgi:hypothetical protein
MKLIRWCMLIGALSLFFVPVGTFCLALWKYNHDKAMQAAAEPSAAQKTQGAGNQSEGAVPP